MVCGVRYAFMRVIKVIRFIRVIRVIRIIRVIVLRGCGWQREQVRVSVSESFNDTSGSLDSVSL